MPQKIQRIPAGVLDVLGMRGTGQLPADMPDFLQGVVDLTPNYVAELLQTVALIPYSTNVAASGAIAAVRVATGRVYRVIGIGIYADTFSVAGTILDIGIALGPGAVGTPATPIWRNRFTAAAIADTYQDGLLFPQPLLVPSGFSFAIAQNVAPVGNYELEVELLCQVLLTP